MWLLDYSERPDLFPGGGDPGDRDNEMSASARALLELHETVTDAEVSYGQGYTDNYGRLELQTFTGERITIATAKALTPPELLALGGLRHVSGRTGQSNTRKPEDTCRYITLLNAGDDDQSSQVILTLTRSYGRKNTTTGVKGRIRDSTGISWPKDSALTTLVLHANRLIADALPIPLEDAWYKRQLRECEVIEGPEAMTVAQRIDEALVTGAMVARAALGRQRNLRCEIAAIPIRDPDSRLLAQWKVKEGTIYILDQRQLTHPKTLQTVVPIKGFQDRGRVVTACTLLPTIPHLDDAASHLQSGMIAFIEGAYLPTGDLAAAKITYRQRWNYRSPLFLAPAQRSAVSEAITSQFATGNMRYM